MERETSRIPRRDLTASLTDFRQMCDRLQQSPLTQLSNQADRDWLNERCAAWAKKIDARLADLNSGRKPLEEVSQEAKSTIDALQDALRKRATELEA